MLDVTNPNATGWMVKRVKETLEELEGDLNKGLVAKAFFHSRFWGSSVISIQGDSKGMVWVALVEGREVWPKMRIEAGEGRHWWMKDGATALTTNSVLNFGKKFCGLVISRRWIGCHTVPTSILWITFSGCQKPSTLDKLKGIVGDFALTVPNKWSETQLQISALLGMQNGKWSSLWSFSEEAVKTALPKDSNFIFKIFLRILLTESCKFFLSQTN